MALFENFPYTNFHELNLDWLVKKVKEIDAAFPAGTVGIEKGGTGADNAADARTNLGIYATNIPTSAVNPSTIENRLQSLAADISTMDGNIDYRIFRSVTKLGQTAGTATLGSCWAAMSTGDILICPPSDFNPAQVPETAGSVVLVRNGGTSGSLRFYGNRTYEMPFVANYPSGAWSQILNSTDVIPIANGGTGGTTAAEALQNLGIDFSGTVLSVAGVGADPTGNVPLTLEDLVATSITELGLPVGSTTAAAWTALPAGTTALFPASNVSDPPAVNNGMILMTKGASSPYPGFIKAFDKESIAEYRMDISSANVASGTWVRNVSTADFKVEIKAAASTTIGANTHQSITIDISEAGYDAVAIVGCRTANNSLEITQFYMTADRLSVIVVVSNVTSSSITSNTIDVRVMYIKT